MSVMETVRQKSTLWFEQYFGIELLFAFILTFIYLMPAIFHHRNFLVYGDNGALYVPAFIQLSHYLHHGVFQGVDWLTHNGSSEFFLRSNIPIYSPIFLLFGFIFHPTTLAQGVECIAWIYFVHLFIGIFFIQLVGKQFFSMNRTTSVLFAVLYIFSFSQTLLVIEPFFLIKVLFPAVMYVFLIATGALSISALFLISLMIFIFLFSGYLPLSLFGLGVASAFTIFYVYINPLEFKRPVRTIVRSFIPAIIAILIAFPGYLAIMKFVNTASTLNRSLEFAAYGIPEKFFEIISSFSSSIAYTSLDHYFIVGLFSLSILFWFLSTLSNSSDFFSPNRFKERALVLVGLAVTIGLALVSFGKDIQLSSVFYFLFPGVGGMHGYQRYFILVSFFYAMSISLILSFLVTEKNIQFLKWTVLGFFILFMIMAVGIYFGVSPASTRVINTLLLLEIFLILLFFISSLLLNRRGILAVSILVCILMGIQYAYPFQIDWNLGDYILENENLAENNNLIDFFKNNSNKTFIKYINLSNKIYDYIPKNYPWMVGDKVHLSNYLGYEEHISEDNNYRKYIHFYGDVDWNWLRWTNADYIVYDADAYKKFKTQIDQFGDAKTVFHLTSGSTVVKAKPTFALYPEGFSRDVFNNGAIILLNTKAAPSLDDFHMTAKNINFNLTVNDNRTRILLPFWSNRNLKLFINGKKVDFDKWNDLYYHDLTQGNYNIQILYKNFPLTVFLWLMSFYYLGIVGILFWRFFAPVYIRYRSPSTRIEVDAYS